MTRPVLIVIDMLNDYFESWEVARREGLVGSINDLVSPLSAAPGAPVVWVRQEFEPDLRDAFPESESQRNPHHNQGHRGCCQILSELAVDSSDPVVIKKRYSAFFGTNLDELLSQLQPDSIVLAGINTHACIRMAAIDAYQAGWPVIVASDCIDSYDRNASRRHYDQVHERQDCGRS